MTPDPAAEQWTNPSVNSLVGDSDPVVDITRRAQGLLSAALDLGLQGPPVDPFQLANLMGLQVVAQADIGDARIEAGGLVSEPGSAPLASYVATSVPLTLRYNPVRPRGRLRYSVAHEIAHALFPDVAETVRHRTGTGAVPHAAGDDGWQLELLCNVAAAELLMPDRAVEGLLDIDPDIDFLMATRARFEVSTEALLRRLVRGTSRQLAMLALSRARDASTSSMRIDYLESSSNWSPPLERGIRLPSESVFGGPTAIGQTIRGLAAIGDTSVRAQAVGIPGYPGSAWPRVLALIEPADAPRATPSGLQLVTGDISQESLPDRVVIAHIVSDAAHGWGGRGVARALARRYPDAARAFRAWTVANEQNLDLGNVHMVKVHGEPPAVVASMVAQRGFGSSIEPRLDYQALADALDRVADRAVTEGAAVILPRIGAGQAGGRWDVVQDLISQHLLNRGLQVSVYTAGRVSEGDRG